MQSKALELLVGLFFTLGVAAVFILTFRVAGNYERDGFSTLVLENAMRYLRSPGFAPQLRLTAVVPQKQK